MSNDTTTAVHGNKSTKNARGYPPLPWGSDFEAWLEARDVYDVVAAFRAYVDADRAARTQPEVAKPVAYRLLRKNSAGEWVQVFNYWCDGAPSQELVNDVVAQSDSWRLEWAFGTPSSVVQTSQEDARQLDAIRQVIRDYHFALDQRQYGGVAEGAALSAIERVLGTGWKQGAEAAARAAKETSQTAAAQEDAEDAARWHWIAEYLVGSRTDLDVDIFSSETVNELRKLVDADRARKEGAKQ